MWTSIGRNLYKNLYITKLLNITVIWGNHESLGCPIQAMNTGSNMFNRI